MAQVLQMRKMTVTGGRERLTSASIYSFVSDNSEESESPWTLNVWARLKGQIRSKRGSPKNALQPEKWGLCRKPKDRHLPGMQTIIWDQSSHLHVASPNSSSLAPPNNSTD